MDGLEAGHRAKVAAGMETRREVYALLSKNPDATISELAKEIGKDQSTVWRHRRAIRAGWKPEDV